MFLKNRSINTLISLHAPKLLFYFFILFSPVNCCVSATYNKIFGSVLGASWFYVYLDFSFFGSWFQLHSFLYSFAYKKQNVAKFW